MDPLIVTGVRRNGARARKRLLLEVLALAVLSAAAHGLLAAWWLAPREVEAALAASPVVQDLDGRDHAPLEAAPEFGVLLFFVDADCPVSNAYVPEMRRIRAEYSQRGLAVYAVYPDPDVAREAVRSHREELGLDLPVLLDPGHVLVRRAGASVTPEAAFFSAAGELLYRGRIDDLFADVAARRAQPRSRELRAALDAVLAGGRPPVARTQALGCFIPGC